MDPTIRLPDPLVKAGRWARSRWDWAATIAGLLIAGGILYFVAIGGTATRDEAPRPTATVPPFAPIRIVRLDVEPETLVLGKPGRLLNGICNDTDHDQAVALYFGAQSAGNGDPLLARTIDLSGRDTPEGRTRVVIAPGCYRTDPIEATVGSGLTPGPWKLVLKVTATGPAGEEQNVTTTSRVFDVRAAE